MGVLLAAGNGTPDSQHAAGSGTPHPSPAHEASFYDAFTNRYSSMAIFALGVAAVIAAYFMWPKRAASS